MKRHSFKTHPVTRLAAGGSLMAAGAGIGTLGAALFAQSAGATGSTFVVTSLADPGAPDPDNCITPAPGACSLREAIQAANLTSGADTVTFDPSLSGTVVLAGSLDLISESLTVAGPGADTITVEGNRAAWGFFEDPALFGTPEGDDFRLEISGLHLNGLTDQFQSLPIGAIATFSGDLFVHDAIVTDSASQVDRGGSGIFGGPIAAGIIGYGVTDARYQNSAIIERVEISHNTAMNSDHSYSYLGNPGSLVAIARHVSLIDSTVTFNSAHGFAGPLLVGEHVTIANTNVSENAAGTIFAGLGVIANSCSITGSQFDHNRSSHNDLYGGALLVQTSSSGSTSETCTIRDTSVSYNDSTTGGALTARAQGAPITIERVTIVGNSTLPGNNVSSLAPTTSSSIAGAAVDVIGQVSIDSSTIANNIGDGIQVSSTNSAPTSIDALVTDNRLPSVRTSASSPFGSTLRLSHSTVSGNSGFGIATADGPNDQPTAQDIVLDHALVYGNGSGPGGDINVPTQSRFSLFGSVTTTPVDGEGGGNIFGVDPNLQSLQWISPLVGFLPIPVGSAAWNTGDPNFTPPPATDQRGLPRVVDIIDIGAYEVQQTAVLPKFTG